MQDARVTRLRTVALRLLAGIVLLFAWQFASDSLARATYDLAGAFGGIALLPGFSLTAGAPRCLSDRPTDGPLATIHPLPRS